MMINTYGQNKGAAWSFISWATSPRIQQWMVFAGQGTNRTSVLQNPLSKQVSPVTVIAETPIVNAQLPGSGANEVAQTNLPSIGASPDTIRVILEKYIGQAIQGTISVDQAAANCDNDLTAYVKQSQSS